MRRAGVWLITVPLALLGVVCAHASANRLLGAPDGPGELFASDRSLAWAAPWLLTLAVVLVLAGVHARIVGDGRLPRRSAAIAVPFGLLPPTAFVVLEVLEGVLNHGVHGELFGSPTFAAGLALEAPFALAGYVLARWLLQLGDSIRLLVAPRLPVRPAPTAAPRARPSHADPPRSRRLSAPHPGRAPPLRPAVSG